jgi:uncharacterized protein YfbU (UPF0304 family)
MGRQTKIVDNYEKVDYWSKIFMYLGPSWNNLGPVVEIIRNLNKNSIISYKYGKGQHTIRTYGTQYFHRVIGCEFKKRDDYLRNIVNGCVKFIFIFSDTSDFFTDNLINIAKEYKIILVGYSNLDSKYHLYNTTEGTLVLDKPEQVIRYMSDLHDYILYKEFVNVFPDFDILTENVNNEFPVLEKCLKILKESNNNEFIKKDKKKIQMINIPDTPSSPSSPIRVFWDPVGTTGISPSTQPIAKNTPNKENNSDKPKMLLSQFFKQK